MRREATALAGVFKIVFERKIDERGHFARTFDAPQLAGWGLESVFPEHSIAWNEAAGTLRGLHFQAEPYGEVKIVRCTRGFVYDVVVDVRRESPTAGRWEAHELHEGTGEALYVPKGFAHGYQTFEDRSEVAYLISAPYVADARRGVRFDDPALGIAWPLPVSAVSLRDRQLPGLAAALGEM